MSSGAAPKLEYQSPTEPVRRVTLEELTDGFELSIPPPAAWAHWLAVAVQLLAIVVWLFIIQMGFQFARSSSITSGDGTIVWAFRMGLWSPLLAVLVYSVIMLYQIVWQRRWGRVPTTLRVGDGKIVHTKPGIWGLRVREWNLSNVKRIEIKRVKSLIPAHRVVDLRIAFKKGWPMVRRLSARDPIFLERLERVIKSVVSQAPPDAIPVSGKA